MRPLMILVSTSGSATRPRRYGRSALAKRREREISHCDKVDQIVTIVEGKGAEASSIRYDSLRWPGRIHRAQLLGGASVLRLRSFPLRMEKVHQVLDFVRLKNITERRHRSAAVMNLMFNFLFVSGVCRRCSDLVRVLLRGRPHRGNAHTLFRERASLQTSYFRSSRHELSEAGGCAKPHVRADDKSHETGCSNDSREIFQVSPQRIKSLSVTI